MLRYSMNRIFPIKSKTHIALRIINICEMGIGGFFTAKFILFAFLDTFVFRSGWGPMFLLISLPFAIVVIIGFRGYCTNNTLQKVDIFFILLLSIFGVWRVMFHISEPSTSYVLGSTWVDSYLNNIELLVFDFILVPLLIIHIILAFKLKWQNK